MTTADQQFQGSGTYAITEADRREVRNFRLALLLSGVSMLGAFCTGGFGGALGLDLADLIRHRHWPLCTGFITSSRCTSCFNCSG